MKHSIFQSIDLWEDMLKILSTGWHSRGALAEMLDITPRHASRLLLHAKERGMSVVENDERAWHLVRR